MNLGFLFVISWGKTTKFEQFVGNVISFLQNKSKIMFYSNTILSIGQNNKKGAIFDATLC